MQIITKINDIWLWHQLKFLISDICMYTYISPHFLTTVEYPILDYSSSGFILLIHLLDSKIFPRILQFCIPDILRFPTYQLSKFQECWNYVIGIDYNLKSRGDEYNKLLHTHNFFSFFLVFSKKNLVLNILVFMSQKINSVYKYIYGKFHV